MVGEFTRGPSLRDGSDQLEPWRWPPDRYEVQITLPPPDYTAVDRYHFAEFAYAAVEGLAGGQALQIRVVRLEDGVVLFDALARVALPFEEW